MVRRLRLLVALKVEREPLNMKGSRFARVVNVHPVSQM